MHAMGTCYDVRTYRQSLSLSPLAMVKFGSTIPEVKMIRRDELWSIVLFLNEFVRSSIFYVWMPMQVSQEPGFGLTFVSVCTTAQFAADAFLKFFYGAIASRGHSAVLVRVGVLLALVSTLVMWHTHGRFVLLALSILYGFGSATVWPAAITHFADASRENLAASMGKAFAPWMAGAGVGLMVANLFVQNMHVVQVMTVSAFVIVVISSWFLRFPTASSAMPLRQELEIVRVLGWRLRGLLLPMVLQTAIIGTIVPFLSVFSGNVLHLVSIQYVIYLVAIGAITFVLLIPLGKLADQFGRLPLLTIAFLLASGCTFIIGVTHNWHTALPPSVGFALSYAAIFPAWNALFVSSVPTRLRTRAIGLFTAVEDSGTVFGPLIGSLAWHYIGPRGPLWSASASMMLLALYFAAWWFRSLSARPTKVWTV